MSITRRSFLAIGGAIGVIGAAVIALPLIRRSEEDLIIEMLRNELPDLRMSAEALDKFVEKFLQSYKNERKLRRITTLTGARMIESLPDVMSDYVLASPIKSSIDFLQEELFRAFFLGTDYLDAYKDADRTVSFLFIPNPYSVGCSNRIARYDT